MRLLLGCLGVGSCVLVTGAWLSGLVDSVPTPLPGTSTAVLDHSLLGRWGLHAATAFHVLISVYFLCVVLWVRRKTFPVRLPATWEIESRRHALWCLPLAGVSLLALAVTWCSGNAAALRAAQNIPANGVRTIHWVLGTAALLANVAAFWQYRTAHRKLTEVVVQVRRELKRIGKA